MHRISPWILWWLGLCLLWFSFTGQWQAEEWSAGLLAAGLGAIWIRAICRAASIRFRPPPQIVSLIGSVALALLRDCVRLGLALCRWTPKSKQFRGGYRRVRIRTEDDPAQAAARRALAIIAVSLAPNSYAVGIDRKRNLMLIHHLLPTDLQKELPL